MSQQVEYKYVASRNIVVNHAFEGGGEWERKQLGQSIIMIYVHIYSIFARKYANQAKI
jgi:uncharacterized membrane protein